MSNISNETELLLKLINENKSILEIEKTMNLSKRQLFQRMTMLKQSGYLIDKKYFLNGDIKYYIKNPFELQTCNSLTLETPNNISSIRMLVTSDSHYGNIDENLTCRDLMVDYCVNQNINVILHLGDILEGVIPGSHHKQKYSSTQEQIQNFLTDYPMVDNLITVALLGNHDASFWFDAGIDIKTIIENRRHDIVPVGYEKGEVNINDFRFSLYHQINRINFLEIPNSQFARINFKGHSHRFKLVNFQNNLGIYVPSSSNLGLGKEEKSIFLGTGIPSVLDIEFKIKGNTINCVIINQYMLVNNQLIKISEIQENVTITQNYKDKTLESIPEPKFYTCFDEVEEKKKVLTPSFMGTKQDAYRGMSQLEKFNNRFNR